MILPALIWIAALQAVVPGAPRGVNDIGQQSYCLETGTCPPPDNGFPRPAPGLMFLAVGFIGLGVAIWRADRARATAPDSGEA
ncbi:MAG TPA: hypothetical protein VFK36_02245 [Gemmatimonadales bacterium]|nr:hypothetical protein [Gemmatimonadales bacterium]